jgi:hypothetical protein
MILAQDRTRIWNPQPKEEPMAWWNNSYDRSYLGGGRDYDRGYRSPENASYGTYRPAPRGMYDEGYSRGRYYGGASGWLDDYDANFRRTPPEQSATYGDQGDQAVRRWARRYGYDEGYEIRPNMGGGGMDRQQGSGGMRSSGGWGQGSQGMRSVRPSGWEQDDDRVNRGGQGRGFRGGRNDWGYQW